MATSGVYTFNVTRDDIIRDAMTNLGKLYESEVPTAQETTDCARKLNMMVKQWQGKSDFAPGLKVWTRERAFLFLQKNQYQYTVSSTTTDNWAVGGTQQLSTSTKAAAATTVNVPSITGISSGDYIGVELDAGSIQWTTVSGAPSGTTVTLAAGLSSQSSSGSAIYTYLTKGNRPILIETVVLRDENHNDTPIGLLDINQYMSLPSKQNTSMTGDPNYIFYEPMLGSGTIWIDVGSPGDMSKYLYVSYMHDVQDFTTTLDNPYYPPEWYRALAWGLTKEVAPMFNVNFTSEMAENFREAMAMAKEAYSETSSMYFQPGNDRA